MHATDSRPEANPAVKLKVNEFYALASKKGAHRLSERAALCGVHRATLDRWLKGAVPSLGVAIQVAKNLGAKVEDIWEGVPS